MSDLIGYDPQRLLPDYTSHGDLRRFAAEFYGNPRNGKVVRMVELFSRYALDGEVIFFCDPDDSFREALMDESYVLKKRMTVTPEFRPLPREKSYLDHDPTKRHSRYRK